MLNHQNGATSFLSFVCSMQSLSLSDTQVADLGPLKGLTALQTLNLSGTKVVDLGPVQDLPNLKAISGAPDAEKQRFDAYRAQKGLSIVSDTIRP